MSADSARAFVKRAMTDKAFADQLVKNSTDEARKKFAQDAGYSFTEADVQSILPTGVSIDQLRNLASNDELPDEVMEAIVGGKSQTEEDLRDIGIGVGVEAAAAVAAAAI
jgi:predicted ribosomally synthesized peptide with nif11-like leader